MKPTKIIPIEPGLRPLYDLLITLQLTTDTSLFAMSLYGPCQEDLISITPLWIECPYTS